MLLETVTLAVLFDICLFAPKSSYCYYYVCSRFLIPVGVSTISVLCSIDVLDLDEPSTLSIIWDLFDFT